MAARPRSPVVLVAGAGCGDDGPTARLSLEVGEEQLPPEEIGGRRLVDLQLVPAPGALGIGRPSAVAVIEVDGHVVAVADSPMTSLKQYADSTLAALGSPGPLAGDRPTVEAGWGTSLRPHGLALQVGDGRGVVVGGVGRRGAGLEPRIQRVDEVVIGVNLERTLFHIAARLELLACSLPLSNVC